MAVLIVDTTKLREFNCKSKIICEIIKTEKYLTAYNLISNFPRHKKEFSQNFAKHCRPFSFHR